MANIKNEEKEAATERVDCFFTAKEIATIDQAREKQNPIRPASRKTFCVTAALEKAQKFALTEKELTKYK